MIGTFITTRYASRHAFDARRPCGRDVSRNGFTEVGVKWMWEMMAGHIRSSDGTLNDHLGGARIVVGTSDTPRSGIENRLVGDTAEAPLDAGFPVVSSELISDDDFVTPVSRITFQATFGEDQAVFDWQERGIVTAQGVLLDRAVSDQGRKPLGAVWTVGAVLELS